MEGDLKPKQNLSDDCSSAASSGLRRSADERFMPLVPKNTELSEGFGSLSLEDTFMVRNEKNKKRQFVLWHDDHRQVSFVVFYIIFL